MRISVVTPSFNMAPYLEETIASVIANLRAGDEYFIVDGGSTDGSVDIIRQYEKHITGWVSEKDDGYADAIGKGFDRASGEILCWINASDLYLSGALDTARSMLTEDVDMIFGDDFYIDASSRVLAFSRGWVPDLAAATLFGAWTPLQEACFWRRGLYESVGGIDRSMKFAADYDLFLRMAVNGRAKYVPLAFSGFRRHLEQKSISGAPAYRIERFASRSRELSSHGRPNPISLFKRLFFRTAMSVRSRVAPIIWQRPDLIGKDIVAMPCAQYWPRRVENRHS